MEFPPAATFNRDSVFSKYTNAERLVYDMYSRPVPLNIDTRSFGTSGTRFNGGSFASAVTDEGQAFHVQSGYHVQQYYKGNVDASFLLHGPVLTMERMIIWKSGRLSVKLIFC